MLKLHSKWYYTYPSGWICCPLQIFDFILSKIIYTSFFWQLFNATALCSHLLRGSSKWGYAQKHKQHIREGVWLCAGISYISCPLIFLYFLRQNLTDLQSAKKTKKNVNVAPDTSSQRVTVVKWECSDSLTPLACHLIILHVLTRICIPNFRHLDRNLNRAEQRIMKTT